MKIVEITKCQSSVRQKDSFKQWQEVIISAGTYRRKGTGNRPVTEPFFLSGNSVCWTLHLPTSLGESFYSVLCTINNLFFRLCNKFFLSLWIHLQITCLSYPLQETEKQNKSTIWPVSFSRCFMHLNVIDLQLIDFSNQVFKIDLQLLIS